MILKDVDLEEFTEEVKRHDQKIVIYGTGVIGRITAPFLVGELGLSDRVLFFADGDDGKWGHYIPLENGKAEVSSPRRMKEIRENFVILVTASRYEGILSDLRGFGFLDKVNVYLLAQMLVRKAGKRRTHTVQRIVEGPVIPRTIHYCWFGKKEMPSFLKECIRSWERFCPEYEIIRWDETNYDTGKYLYTEQAGRHGKWAFVSDVARLDILYRYGGIYLDTDVELVRGIDELLCQPGFCSVEKWGIVNTGGGCGCVKGHRLIKAILAERTKMAFEREDGSLNLSGSGLYETLPLLDRGFLPNNTSQMIDGMTVYSSEFFHPYDYMSGELCMTEYTYGIHHFSGSWVS